MALSFSQYIGDGTTLNFSVSFPYLRKEHVEVKVDGSAVTFTWADPQTITLTTAPAADAVVDVRRKTPREDRMVDFNDGSVLTEADLDLNALQTFYIVQEAIDIAGGTLGIEPDGSYTANFRRIGNVGTPINAGDAVTKAWAETAMSSQLAQAIAAKDAVKVSETNAKASENAAKVSATNAKASENASKTSETNSASSASASQTSRLASEAARDAAIVARDTTLGYRNEAEDFVQDFQGRYYGALSSQPTTNPAGNPCQTGDLYFDTTAGVMLVFRSGVWVDAGTAKEKRFYFTATAGQTTFSGADSTGYTLAYTVGTIDVYLNGVRLMPADYSATTGTSIILAKAAVSGDELAVVAFGAFNVANTYTRGEIDAKDASKLDKAGGTMTGPLVLPGDPSAALQAAPKRYVDNKTALKIAHAHRTDGWQTHPAGSSFGFAQAVAANTGGYAVGGTVGNVPVLHVQQTGWYRVTLNVYTTADSNSRVSVIRSSTGNAVVFCQVAPTPGGDKSSSNTQYAYLQNGEHLYMKVYDAGPLALYHQLGHTDVLLEFMGP